MVGIAAVAGESEMLSWRVAFEGDGELRLGTVRRRVDEEVRRSRACLRNS